MNLCIISWKESPNILRSSWLVKVLWINVIKSFQAAFNDCLKVQNLSEIVISTTDVEADIATKQQEQLQLQVEYDGATQELTEAGDELV